MWWILRANWKTRFREQFDTLLQMIPGRTNQLALQFPIRTNSPEWSLKTKRRSVPSTSCIGRIRNKHIACLNFASARNPGGGFLNGSEAQEESLTRASGLFRCLEPHQDHYAEGRTADGYYTDSMLWSPGVPFIRNDSDLLIQPAIPVSVITAAAVNVGLLRQNRKRLDRVEDVMQRRIEKVLSIATMHRVDAIVLGAWGCGVFQNDPKLIANLFFQTLQSPRFENVFETIYFAVLDKRKIGNFDAFEFAFKSA